MFVLSRGNFDEIIEKISKIMINIMAHKKIFPEVWGDFEENIAGYPSILVDGEKYYFRAAVGFIYMPLSLVKSSMFNIKLEIMNKISVLVKLLGGYGNIGLNNHHSIIVSKFTNLKVKSSQHGIVCDPPENNSHHLIQLESGNVICRKTNARFTWYFMNIDEFNFEVTDASVEKTLCSNVCSIFYDGDNILDLPDLTFIEEFTREMCKHAGNIYNKTILLTKFYNILSLELNQYWGNLRTNLCKLSPITGVNIKYIAYGDISGKTVSDSVCISCGCLLYEKSYVLHNSGMKNNSKNRRDVDDNDAPYKLICPLCVHMNSSYYRKICNLMYVTDVPRSAEDVIDTLDCSDMKKQIMKKILQKNDVVVETIKTDYYTKMKYIVIDDEYIAVDNVKKSIFLGQCAGKKIINFILV